MQSIFEREGMGKDGRGPRRRRVNEFFNRLLVLALTGADP
jgi:hypothetical protein